MYKARCTALSVVASVLAVLACVPCARGQPGAGADGKEGYIYTYARPGQATQTVYIWGAVDKPGIWEVAPETDLVELFSVVHPSGFATEGPDTQTDVRLRIHRVRDGETEVVHTMKLEELLDRPPARRPSLQAQDVIEVRLIEERKFGLELIGTVVGTLSSVTLLIIRLADF